MRNALLTITTVMNASLSPRIILALAACVLILAGCDTAGPVDVQHQEVSLIAPPRMLPGERLPVVAEVLARDGEGHNGIDVGVTNGFLLQASSAILEDDVLSVKKGRGSVTTRVEATGDFELAVGGMSGQRSVAVADTLPTRHYAGTLSNGAHVWDASADRIVDEDVVVPEGVELAIAAGTRIRLAPAANLIVRGALRVEGTVEAPVLFAPATTADPWGGVVVEKGTADVTYAFFTGGGGDDTREFGHSNSQPVFHVRAGQAALQHSFFLDNPGKALGGSSGRLSFDRGLISRCDTGGEFHGSVVHVTRTHILDIPNDDGTFVDDDNDGLYIAGVHDSEDPSKVEHTYIITGKDDAIDHNGAMLEINHSWLEGFMHEGVAGSNAHWVRIYDTVVRGNEQGIEAGYYEPNVFVDHSVIVDNDVGLRFGDSYDNGSRGHMTVTNTILYGNGDNVRNFDVKTQGPVQGAIDIRFSMTNDLEYLGCTGCIEGEPQFDEQYYLLPGSPGLGAGEDGTDLGRARQQ